MPGQTTRRGYPYPLLGEAPNGPQAIQQLAEDIDADWSDSGWVVYTNPSGWSGTIECRRIGPVAQLFMSLNRDGAATTSTFTMFQLAASQSPSRSVSFAVMRNDAYGCRGQFSVTDNVVYFRDLTVATGDLVTASAFLLCGFPA